MQDAISYAWRGSGKNWRTVEIGVIGGIIGGFIYWVLGLKMPSQLKGIAENPLWGAALGVLACALAGVAIVFFLRLIWYPIHKRLGPHGGLFAALKKRLGTALLPFVLAALGFTLFVLFEGAAVIVFVSKQTEVAAGGLSAPEKRFTAYEVERQLKAIDEIKYLVVTDVKDIWLSGGILRKQLENNFIANKGLSSNSASLLDEFADKSSARLDALQNKINEYKEYAYLNIMGLSKDNFTPYSVVAHSRNCAVALRNFSSDSETRYMVGNQDFVNLGNVLGNLGGWANGSEKRLIEERKRVEDLPVYQ